MKTKPMSPIEIYDILRNKFLDAECELNFNSNFELLVAVILSAQCTDKRVNEVTSEIFKKYNTPQDFASMPLEKLEKMIYSCGFYHNKAKNIISASQQIISDFGGEVPSSVEELQKLKGVGKKTANVVYSTAFGGDAVAVDTHVFRTSNRLGLSNSKNVKKCEQDLMETFPQNKWNSMHLLLVFFGRYQCKAIHPLCENCEFKGFCKYYNKKQSKLK